jgi:putative ABC transport system ATP-binding protein
MLKAHGLRYVRNGQEILANVEVTVEPGESLAVTGPSGSGKTTLLSLLSGLAAPTAGEVYIDGQPLTKFAGPALGVAVVLQGYGLVSLLSATENIEIALGAAGRPAVQASETARSVLARLGLEAHADQLIEELSGGQQQRTAVARALALAPRLLIADEPTAELDPAARAVALGAMFEVAATGGSLILATHDPEVAARCDRVLELKAGRMTSQRDQPRAPGDSTARDSTARDSTARDSTARDSAAGDSTAGDSTAGDSTTRDSTAGDSTAGREGQSDPPASPAARSAAGWHQPAHALPDPLTAEQEIAELAGPDSQNAPPGWSLHPPPQPPLNPRDIPATPHGDPPAPPARSLHPPAQPPLNPGSVPATPHGDPPAAPGWSLQEPPQPPLNPRDAPATPHGDPPAAPGWSLELAAQPPPDSGDRLAEPAYPPPGRLSPSAVPPGLHPQPAPPAARPARAEHERQPSPALPPLRQRGAMLRDYLEGVRRRGRGAARSDVGQRAGLARPAGPPRAGGASPDEQELIRMAREDLAGFADLGLRLLELHQRMDLAPGPDSPNNAPDIVPRCLSCMWRWPCPTFLTLAEILDREPRLGPP